MKVISSLELLAEDCKDIARQIYYAKSMISPTHPAQQNLNLALMYLGVSNPKDVGLSDSILKYKVIREQG